MSRQSHISMLISGYTVYPKKYAHGYCFAVLCCGYTLTDFPISIRLTSLALGQSNDCPSASKATLMNMDKYFMWIHYERLHNHNKAKHNKTVCIFLGIYCMLAFFFIINNYSESGVVVGHRHGWLVKHQWAGSVLGSVTRDEYQMLGSTSIPARLDTLVYWVSFSWLIIVGTTRNKVIRHGCSRIGLAVLILYAAGAGLMCRPAVTSGRYNKCHLQQLPNHYAHSLPMQHTLSCENTITRNWSWEMIMGFVAFYAGRGWRNHMWSGKEAHWSLRGLIVRSAEHCGADYKPIDR